MLATVCTRGLCTSSSLLRKSLEGAVRALGLSREEVEELGVDGADALANPLPDALHDAALRIERDAGRYQRQVQRKTVERKYFSGAGSGGGRWPEENLLTWSMKEQLRYLHTSDPHTWTPEALATAFPASPAGIRKLLRVRWVPENEAAIQRHDQRVAQRWKQLTKGQLGAAALIDKMIPHRPSQEISPVTSANTEQMMATLQSLKFEGEEDFPTITKSPRGKKSKKQQQQPASPHNLPQFSSILTHYEHRLAEVEVERGAELESKSGATLPPSASPIHIPHYQGSRSTVTQEQEQQPQQSTRGRREKRSIKSVKKQRKMMTFEEFMKQK